MALHSVGTQQIRRKDNPRQFSINVQQETRICGRYEIEEHVSMAFVYPPLHDTSMPGAVESSTTRPITMTTTSTTSTPPTTTTSTTTMPPTTTTTTFTTTPKSCPHSGYQLYPEFNCYKAFPSYGERKTWDEAREQCKRDGGDLMVMESEREREDVYIPLRKSARWWTDWLWVGVDIPQGGNDWTTVDGEPALSTWWAAGYPKKNAARKCAVADDTGQLGNTNCASAQPFICEISL